MSTEVQVSTWEQLVSALNNNSYPQDAYPVFITLQNDIDMNDVAPTGVGTTTINTNTSSYTKVLDMCGHKIKNLRTSTSNPQPIFTDGTLGASLHIFNGDFVNLVCSGADFINFSHQSGSALTLEKVRIVGFRTGASYLYKQSDSAVKITLDRCYIDFPWYGANSSDYSYVPLVPYINNDPANAKATYCWFHETHGGWEVPYGENNARAMTSFAPLAIDGCYIDGEVKLKKVQNGSSIYYYVYNYTVHPSLSYTASTPNVLDIDWSISGGGTNNSSANTQRINALFKKPVSGVKNQYAISTPNGVPEPIFATAEQMISVEWLRSQGFPVIEPTT